MPLKRGRPPMIESQKIIDAVLEESKSIIISNTGSIADKNHFVWQKISKNLNNKISPHSLYAYVTDDRFQLKSQLFEREGLYQTNSTINNTTVNESVHPNIDESDISLHENVRQSYVIYLTKEEFKALIVVKNQSRSGKKTYKSQYKALAPTVWEDVIFDRLVESFKITCGLSFKNHTVTWDERYGAFTAYCACGGTCNGTIKNDPNNKFVEITCSMMKGNGVCGKRWIRSEKRKKLVAEMGPETVHAYRSEKAAEIMEFGDDEPPNLPSSSVLRNARYQERTKKFIHKDPVRALQILKHTDAQFIIRDIGLDPFFVYYWSRHQLGMYKNYVNKGVSCLCIDATGGLFKPIIKYDDIKSKYMYLYHGVIKLEAGQFPVVQMISETQKTNDIHSWLMQWVGSGAPPPSEIVIDGGRAILTGAVRTFTSSSTIHEYADSCYGPTAPTCYIRIDNAHYIKTWVNLLKDVQPMIKTFYQGAIGRLIISTDRTEAKTLVRNILILSQSDTYGKLDDGTDSAAEKAYNYIKAIITNTDLSAFDVEVIKEYGDIDISSEDDVYVDNNISNRNNNQINKKKKKSNRWLEWGLEANEEVRLLKMNETGDRVNAHYNPAIAKKLLDDLPDLPLWSCVTRNEFGFGRIPATSSPVEGDFNIVKNSFFKNVVLPMRVDEFVHKFIKFLDGKLKLINAQEKKLNKNNQNNCGENLSDKSADEILDSLLIPTSSNSTTCPACILNDKPSGIHVCLICQKSIHNLNGCSIPLSSEGFGQQRICVSCNDLENLEVVLSSQQQENWGGKTVESVVTINRNSNVSLLNKKGVRRNSFININSEDSDSDNNAILKEKNSDARIMSEHSEPVNFTSCPACIQNDKPSGIHKCINCFTPIHNLDACSTPVSDEEGFGQKRLCLACTKLTTTLRQQKSIILHSEKNEKKTAKYLGENPNLIAEQINFKIKPTPIALIKNGSNDGLAASNIYGKQVYAINTCAFDSFYQIITTAIYDWENFRIKIQDQHLNMMYSLALGIYNKKTTFTKLYTDRARFHYNFMKSVEQPDSSILIDCKISIVQIVLKIFENSPSCQTLVQCDRCGQKNRNNIIVPVLYMNDIKNGHLDLENLSNLMMTSQCGKKGCTGMKKTSITSIGNMVIFEVFNAHMDEVVRLDALPKGFRNPINPSEEYRLVGAVNLINPGSRRRYEKENAENSNIGHFTALCLRGTQWWEFNDVLQKPKVKKGSTPINLQILAYIKI